MFSRLSARTRVRATIGFVVLALPWIGVQAQQRPAPATSPGPVQGTADQAQATTALQALFAAAERGDMAALDTLYAGDSLTVIEGAGINRTWADYRDHHLGPEMKEMKNMQYRPTDIEMHVAGNTAWAIFRYSLKADMNGRPADVVGRGTAILERRGPRWVVRHTHTSGRARRPNDPTSP